MGPVRTGVIDVGSNTIRLLVTALSRGGLGPIANERTHLGLASDIERAGEISDAKLFRVQELAARYAAIASGCAVDRLAVVVTAPGRQSGNPRELHDTLAQATSAPVWQLSAEEEGRLAYAGAVGACLSVPDTIGVVDVGGGSTQLMVGTAEGPAWLRTLELGSLRLTERFIPSDPPTLAELDAVESVVAETFARLTPPLPLGGLATGGTARGLRRIVGRRLDDENLTAALAMLTTKTADQIAADFSMPVERARVLPAGTIVLREAHRRLAVKLKVAKGGVREGVARALLAERAAEAA
jgi:exopolyphosphatase/guanosine-5'-triphosphate,3'-diphosphate pyrophosphatase